MAELDLRREIELGLRAVWPAFARKHPRLAARCDMALVLDAAVEGIEDEPNYGHAIADALASRTPYQEMIILFRRLTKDWLELAVRA